MGDWPKEVEPPFGLPPTWKCMEYMYKSGKSAGKTYIRYTGPRGEKGLSSITKAIEKEAEALGDDPLEKIAEYKRLLAEKEEEKKRQREAEGKLEGERREAAIAAFRERHGALDGATVCAIEGWRGEAKLLVNCGQTSMRYHSPHGKTFSLIKDIECYYGWRMLEHGEDFPELDAAFEQVQSEQVGARKFNPVRTMFEQEMGLADQDESKRRKIGRAHREMTNADYQQSTALRVVASDITPSELKQAGAVNVADKAFDMAEIRKALQKRGFGDKVDFAVVFATARGTIADRFSGLYYKMAHNYNDAPCYKYVAMKSPGNLYCKNLFLFRSQRHSGWKIGEFDDSRAGLARSANTNDLPKALDVQQSWMLLQDEPR